jgi:hypothetical protein
MSRSPDTAPMLRKPYTRRDGPSGDNAYIRDPRLQDAQTAYSLRTRLKMDAAFSHALERAIATGRERKPRG